MKSNKHKSGKSSDNLGEDFDDEMEETKEGKIFGDEKKSCFRKEKENNKSPSRKHVVKISSQTEKKTEDDIIDEVKEKRKKRTQFKTVKDPTELKQDKYGINDKFIRKGKRSTTLVEKAKLSDKLLKAEMSLTVKQDILVIEEKGNPSKKYKPKNMLGSGSFGSVYEAKNTIFGNTVAMKVIKKDKENELDEQEIRNEIDILKQLSHPNIVKIYEFFISENHYYIITEFCKEGELFNQSRGVEANEVHKRNHRIRHWVIEVVIGISSAVVASRENKQAWINGPQTIDDGSQLGHFFNRRVHVVGRQNSNCLGLGAAH